MRPLRVKIVTWGREAKVEWKMLACPVHALESAFVVGPGRWEPSSVEAAGLEITVTCSKCGRSVLIDASDEAMRDRRLCGARLVCTTVLPHGPTCTGSGHLRVDHAGSWTAQVARAPNRVFRP
jgi:hypothetical protein